MLYFPPGRITDWSGMTLLDSIVAKGRRLFPKGLSSPRETPAPCMNCGCRKAFMVGTPIRPDFDTSALLPPGLHEAFMDRMDGFCVNCGFYQAYKRFTVEQLRQINSFGKDITTREAAFHQYPAPPEFVRAFNHQYFGLR